MKTVAIVSGGMDSVTLAHHLASLGDEMTVISFDYGQRHACELEFAAQCALDLNADHELVDLTSITRLLGGSALTTTALEIPDGHYAEESMKATVVPNRNAIMISVAGALAAARNYDRVAIGVHGGDHFIYPDCRPPFIGAMNMALAHGNEGMTDGELSLIAPFIEGDKTDIACIGDKLNVPWAQTWSCYKGGDIHCGSCGTCVERREAFKCGRVEDPTPYLSTPSFPPPSS